MPADPTGTPEAGPAGSRWSGRTLLAGALCALGLAPVAYFAIAMPGMDHSSDPHTPHDGEIEGTDLFIPYDEVRDATELPEQKDAEIVVYCRTGRMSRIAADGYTQPHRA